MLQKKRKIDVVANFCATALLASFSAHTALAQFDGFYMPTPPAGTPGNFAQSIVNLTNWILGFVTMIAVLMIIWGGIGYLTSAGDEDKARTGKKTLTYALIGLVVAGIAYALVNVVVSIILV
ncbi:MAG: pilin [Patescibacteria group bacterium]|nr:pilin [Patescibacteria group bacterium]